MAVWIVVEGAVKAARKVNIEFVISAKSVIACKACTAALFCVDQEIFLGEGISFALGLINKLTEGRLVIGINAVADKHIVGIVGSLD